MNIQTLQCLIEDDLNQTLSDTSHQECSLPRDSLLIPSEDRVVDEEQVQTNKCKGTSNLLPVLHHRHSALILVFFGSKYLRSSRVSAQQVLNEQLEDLNTSTIRWNRTKLRFQFPNNFIGMMSSMDMLIVGWRMTCLMMFYYHSKGTM